MVLVECVRGSSAGACPGEETSGCSMGCSGMKGGPRSCVWVGQRQEVAKAKNGRKVGC
jgi:hypothetical protein